MDDTNRELISSCEYEGMNFQYYSFVRKYLLFRN
jgi:hypothetical protein